MYNLFLETRAAAQIRAYCRAEVLDPACCEEILMKAYKNACKCRMYMDKPGGFDGYLFDRCVNTDDHYGLDIDRSFLWGDTPEGSRYWARVHQHRPPIPLPVR